MAYLQSRAAIVASAAGTTNTYPHMQGKPLPSEAMPSQCPASQSPPGDATETPDSRKRALPWLPPASDFKGLWAPAVVLCTLTSIFDARGESIQMLETSLEQPHTCHDCSAVFAKPLRAQHPDIIGTDMQLPLIAVWSQNYLNGLPLRKCSTDEGM